ncbi:hypothetical protein HOLleu_08052 [Holothuria leucospilota]|uniref:Uncharacterized protein n=1 Tax=Holothuria leucospilota TaxID=206669 RepID=A0A9Q1HHJ0_HOLLE|nr:hypothetical protein HOLleu_08052 [Holothuria leucospilota]
MIYGCHASIGVILAAYTVDKRIACFQIFLLISVCEYVFTMKKNKHGDWKCLSPSVFIYLLWLVPQIIILQAHSKTTRADNSTTALIPWGLFQSLVSTTLKKTKRIKVS